MKYLAALALFFLSTSVYGAGTVRLNMQNMTVAAGNQRDLKVVDINCDGKPIANRCTLSGTHIFHSATKPMGAIGSPNDTCYMEAGQSEINVSPQGGSLISQD